MPAKGQVLITLLFGDKLNTPNIEFGLHAGINFANLSGIEESKYKSDLNLGFFFDFRINDKLWFHPEVLIKSGSGARSLDPYETGDENLDVLLADAKLERNLGYVQVPILMKYKFYRGWGVEGGIQPALMLYGATDEFTDKVFEKEDLYFEKKKTDEYSKLDFGLTGGISWRPNQTVGVTIVARYTHGFVNILKDDSAEPQKNRAFLVGALIPIGVKKAEARRAAKEEEEGGAEGSKEDENK